MRFGVWSGYVSVCFGYCGDLEFGRILGWVVFVVCLWVGGLGLGVLWVGILDFGFVGGFGGFWFGCCAGGLGFGFSFGLRVLFFGCFGGLLGGLGLGFGVLRVCGFGVGGYVFVFVVGLGCLVCYLGVY